MIDEFELKNMERLHKKLTPGPWRFYAHTGAGCEGLCYCIFAGENEFALARVREKAEAVYAARKALSDEYGARGFIMDYWNGDTPTGIYFTEPSDLPFLKDDKRETNGIYGYYPKLNTKKGKELKEKLADKALVFSASRMIISELKLHRMVSCGRILAYSTAGYTETSILVSIPSGENNFDPMPEVPAWLQEVKESEWLAAQGE